MHTGITVYLGNESHFTSKCTRATILLAAWICWSTRILTNISCAGNMKLEIWTWQTLDVCSMHAEYLQGVAWRTLARTNVAKDGTYVHRQQKPPSSWQFSELQQTAMLKIWHVTNLTEKLTLVAPKNETPYYTFFLFCNRMQLFLTFSGAVSRCQLLVYLFWCMPCDFMSGKSWWIVSQHFCCECGRLKKKIAEEVDENVIEWSKLLID